MVRRIFLHGQTTKLINGEKDRDRGKGRDRDRGRERDRDRGRVIDRACERSQQWWWCSVESF